MRTGNRANATISSKIWNNIHKYLWMIIIEKKKNSMSEGWYPLILNWDLPTKVPTEILHFFLQKCTTTFVRKKRPSYLFANIDRPITQNFSLRTSSFIQNDQKREVSQNRRAKSPTNICFGHKNYFLSKIEIHSALIAIAAAEQSQTRNFTPRHGFWKPDDSLGGS